MRRNVLRPEQLEPMLLKIFKLSTLLFVCLILYGAFFHPVFAAVGINKQINFQGKLVNLDGTNYPNSTAVNIVFTWYDDSIGSNVLGTETQSVTPVDGLFRVTLASSLPADFNTDSIWLGIKVGSDSEMNEKVRMTAVPYAFEAEKVNGLTVTNNGTNTLNIGAGLTLAVSTANKTITGSGTQISIGGNLTTNGALTFGSGSTGTLTLGSGSDNLSIATTASTSVTLPTSGTLLSTATTSTRGDLVYASANNTVGLLNKGANGECLQSSTTTVQWGSCGTATALALDAITDATDTNTLSNGDFAQVWDWHLTTNGTTAFAIGESTASTATTSTILGVSTLATSTAKPFSVGARGTTIIDTSALGAVTIAAASSQALTLTGNAASIWSVAGANLDIKTTTSGILAITSAGTLNIKTVNQSAGSTNSTDITIASGDAGGVTSNSGNISIDSGTATQTSGTVSIGTSNASGVIISKAGITTSVNGNLDVAGTSQFGSGNVNLIDSTGKITAISSTYFTSLDGSTLTGLTKSQVGLSNVENTALSTWAGTSNITTLGTLTGLTVSSSATAGDATSITTNSLNTALANGTNLTFKNNNTAGAGLAVNGLTLTETAAAAPLSGTNTSNLLNLAASLNGTVNGVNISSATGFTNFLKTPSIVIDSSGNVTGAGTIAGGTYNGATIATTTFNTATISGGTLSGGSLSGGTYTGTSIAGTGSFTLTGGTASGNTLTLISTTDGTKGDIQFFSSSNKLTSAGALTVAGAIISSNIASGASLSGSNTGDQNLSGYVPTSTTVNGKALSGNITLGLASADFANQGTTTTVLHGNGAGNPSFGAIVTNDITASNVTYAKIQNVTAADRILGRSTAGAGVLEEITVGGDLAQSGSTFTIQAAAVSLSKMANLAASSIMGNNTGGAATPLALSAAQVKTLLAIANTDVSGLGTMSTQNASAVAMTGGTHTGVTSLGIRSSGSGAFDLTLANTENLGAGRTLTLTTGDAARTLNLTGGNLTVSTAAKTLTGAGTSISIANNLTFGAGTTGTLVLGSTTNNLTFATGGDTTLTLPTSGTVTALGNAVVGSGSIVLASTPTLTTPVLGVATATSISMTGNLQVDGTISTSGTGQNLELQASGVTEGNTNNGSIYFLDSGGTTKGRVDTRQTSGSATLGDLTVSGTTTINSVETAITPTTNSGQAVVTVTSTTSFAVGDLVMLIQMSGTGNGLYEEAIVQSIDSATQMTMTNNLTNTYTAAAGSVAQAVEIPSYNNITVQSGGVLQGTAWNGTIGGVLYFKANKVTVDVGGIISMNGRGFLAGTGGTHGNGGAAIAPTAAASGTVGSSGNLPALSIGVPVAPTGGAFGVAGAGAVERGGGGGRSGAMGSGGTYGAVGTTGSAGGSGGAGGNGGGVGGTTGGAGGTAPAAYGCADFSSSTGCLYLGNGGTGGSGGGGGGQATLNISPQAGSAGGNGGDGGAGGNGGGIVAIFASTIANSGTISSNGAAGSAGTAGTNGTGGISAAISAGGAGGGSGGGGGGGAGGAVWLSAPQVTVGTLTATGGAVGAGITGGTGGICNAAATDGGGGGGGGIPGGTVANTNCSSLGVAGSAAVAAAGAGAVGRTKCDNASAACGGAPSPAFGGPEVVTVGPGTSGYGTLYIGNVNTASADLAEYYVTGDKSIEPGDVVSLSDTRLMDDGSKQVTNKGVLRKSGSVYDQKAIGVISTAPGLTLGSVDGASGKADKRQLALSGRVPVKVSTENGPIQIGDYLTSSTVSGIAMKASKPGRVIGKAMDNYSEAGVGVIEVFMNVTYADPRNILALTIEDLSVIPAATDEASQPKVLNLSKVNEATQSGDLSTNLSTLSSKYVITKTDSGLDLYGILNNESGQQIVAQIVAKNAIFANAQAGLLWTDNLVSNGLQVKGIAKINEIDLSTLKPTDGNEISLNLNPDGTIVIKDKDGANAITFDALGNATFKGTVNADKIRANQIEGLTILTNELITDKLSSLSSKNATGSATQVASLNTGDLNVLGVFKVSKGAEIGLDAKVLGELETGGGLTVGGPIEVKGNALFRAIAQFLGKVTFKNSVTFEDRVYFNKDTAGQALVKKDQSEVTVIFDKPYVQAPLITASITLDKIEGIDDSAQEERQKQFENTILNGDVRYIVTRRTNKGFMIKLNKSAIDDIKFSWTAVAVNDPTLSQSGDPVANLSPNPSNTPTPSNTPQPSIEPQIASSSATITVSGKKVQVNPTDLGFLRVREAPNTNSNERGQVSPPQMFAVLDEKFGWYEIEFFPGQIGWVSGTYVSVKQ